MIMEFLLLDASFGPLGFFAFLLNSPIVVALLVALGVFLLYKGIRAIVRELQYRKAAAGTRTPEDGGEVSEEEPAAGDEDPAPEEKHEAQ